MPDKLVALFALTPLVACAHSTITGTRIRDTDENRQVLTVIEQMTKALGARDAAGVLALVSPRYFEDNGTAQQSDDYGFAELRDKVLPESMAVAKEIQLELQVQEIIVEGEKAYANVRYHSRARLELPSGSLWDSHREFNRIELEREEGGWRITRGL